ncbi:MAG: hypothetical protein QME60_04110 [Verrucomicrobiota bacterium]|nr:hypothetical protein [Verrucomicrobiota bacterium]
MSLKKAAQPKNAENGRKSCYHGVRLGHDLRFPDWNRRFSFKLYCLCHGMSHAVVNCHLPYSIGVGSEHETAVAISNSGQARLVIGAGRKHLRLAERHRRTVVISHNDSNSAFNLARHNSVTVARGDQTQPTNADIQSAKGHLVPP